MGISLSRVRGCVLGAALGDAFGAPFEFMSASDAVWQLGGDRIVDLVAPARNVGPHSVWGKDAAPGTGTDETRCQALFVALAVELGRMPTADELAARWLAVLEHPGEYFVGHEEAAHEQFAAWEGVCRGRLGQTCDRYPGVPPEVLRERSVGLNEPALIGLTTFAPAGLLFGGDPVEAYRHVWLTDFFDVGYAREATAVFAAAIALASRGELKPRQVLYQVEDLDPYDLGGPFGAPRIKDQLLARCQGVELRGPESVVAKELSIALRNLPPHDPLRALVVAFAATLGADGDPLRAIRLAVGHRAVEGRDKLAGFLDIDAYGSLAGALAGALFGDESFEPDLLECVVEANRAQYGLDLEVLANRLAAVVG